MITEAKALKTYSQPIVEDVIECYKAILQHYRQNPKKPKYPALVNISFYIANNAIPGEDDEAKCDLIKKLGKAIQNLVEEGLIVVGAAANSASNVKHHLRKPASIRANEAIVGTLSLNGEKTHHIQRITLASCFLLASRA